MNIGINAHIHFLNTNLIYVAVTLNRNQHF